MDPTTTRFGVSLVLVIILAGLVALAPNGWWALGVFVVVIPIVFASLIWAAGHEVTIPGVAIGSAAMIAGVAIYFLAAAGLSQLIGPIAWFVVPVVAVAAVAPARQRATADR